MPVTPGAQPPQAGPQPQQQGPSLEDALQTMQKIVGMFKAPVEQSQDPALVKGYQNLENAFLGFASELANPADGSGDAQPEPAPEAKGPMPINAGKNSKPAPQY